MRLAQAQLMEYIILILFVMIIIVMLALFLTGWQISNIEYERQKSFEKKAMFLTKSLITSPYLNKKGYEEGSMFEDSKLTVLTCEDLQQIFGMDWWVEIQLVDSMLSDQECNEESFPMCGKWTFCKDEKKQYISFEIPVNVYRKISGDVNIAIMRVGLYV